MKIHENAMKKAKNGSLTYSCRFLGVLKTKYRPCQHLFTSIERTPGFTVQWGDHVQQGLLYSGVAVFDRIYCRVGWPCSTGFTAQWNDRV